MCVLSFPFWPGSRCRDRQRFFSSGEYISRCAVIFALHGRDYWCNGCFILTNMAANIGVMHVPILWLFPQWMYVHICASMNVYMFRVHTHTTLVHVQTVRHIPANISSAHVAYGGVMLSHCGQHGCDYWCAACAFTPMRVCLYSMFRVFMYMVLYASTHHTHTTTQPQPLSHMHMHS